MQLLASLKHSGKMLSSSTLSPRDHVAMVGVRPAAQRPLIPTAQGLKTARASNDGDDDDDDNLDGFASKREKRLAANREAAKCSRQKKKE